MSLVMVFVLDMSLLVSLQVEANECAFMMSVIVLNGLGRSETRDIVCRVIEI